MPDLQMTADDVQHLRDTMEAASGRRPKYWDEFFAWAEESKRELAALTSKTRQVETAVAAKEADNEHRRRRLEAIEEHARRHRAYEAELAAQLGVSVTELI